jgi:hypothetical protein
VETCHEAEITVQLTPPTADSPANWSKEEGAVSEPAIGPNPHPSPAAYREYDPRAPEVARRVAEIIHRRLPDVIVEHVGSTAVPGCGGKGVVDLLAPYRNADELAAIKATLDDLGWQRQRSQGAFP